MRILPSLFIALDFEQKNQVEALLERLSPVAWDRVGVKIGLEMFTHFGPAWVASVVAREIPVFLDLKFHDIPNTVAKACQAAAQLGVSALTVHALGGREMLLRAQEAVAKSSDPPAVLAVTLLTSLSETDRVDLGLASSLSAQVIHLATLAQTTGLAGVVCSAQEAALVRAQLGPAFCLVTPGIRLPQEEVQDQKRVMTPQAAFEAGSDCLVMGRSITQALDPRAVVERVLQWQV